MCARATFSPDEKEIVSEACLWPVFEASLRTPCSFLLGLHDAFSQPKHLPQEMLSFLTRQVTRSITSLVTRRLNELLLSMEEY